MLPSTVLHRDRKKVKRCELVMIVMVDQQCSIYLKSEGRYGDECAWLAREREYELVDTLWVSSTPGLRICCEAFESCSLLQFHRRPWPRRWSLRACKDSRHPTILVSLPSMPKKYLVVDIAQVKCHTEPIPCSWELGVTQSSMRDRNSALLQQG